MNIFDHLPNILITIIYLISMISIGRLIVKVAFKQISFNKYLLTPIYFIFGNFLLTITAYFFLLLDRLDFIVPFFWGVSAISAYYNMATSKVDLRRWELLDLSLLLIFLAAILLSLSNTIYIWDGKASWILKGISFFYSEEFPNALFESPHVSFVAKEYPMWYSLSIGLLFRLFGGVDEIALKVFLPVHYLLLITFSVGVIRHYFRSTKGFTILAILCLIYVNDMMLSFFDSGYLDIGHGLYMGVFIFIAIETSRKIYEKDYKILKELIPLSLVILLSSLYIKNEGSTLVICGLIGVTAQVLLIGKWRLNKLNWRAIGVSLLLVVPFLSWLIIRSHYNYEVGLFAGESRPLFDLINDRLFIILRRFIFEMMQFHSWGFGLFATVLGVIFYQLHVSYLFIRDKAYINLLLISIPGIILLMQFSFYVLVFVITPLDLEAHLGSSLNRVCVQLVPGLFVYTIFLTNFIFKKERT